MQEKACVARMFRGMFRVSAMGKAGARQKEFSMCEVIDIRGRIHESNVKRIALNVLDTIGANPHDQDMVKAIHYSTEELNNWSLILFIINRCFPSPSLNKVLNPSVIENLVIEVLVREHLNRRSDRCRVCPSSRVGG